jgi:hypothetical protein
MNSKPTFTFAEERNEAHSSGFQSAARPALGLREPTVGIQDFDRNKSLE